MSPELSGVGWPVGGRPKPERAWSLWRSGKLAYAETIEHPFGDQVRVYSSDCSLFSLAFATRERAEQIAQTLKRARLERGWTDRPPTPDQ